MAHDLMSIGELATRAAVPVKTLRYYSDIGVVPPADRTSSGYRLYGEREHLRLETVKTLRVLGFSLDEIAGVLDDDADLRTTIEVQLRAVRLRLRSLQRVAVVLQAALDRADEPTSAHLARLETVARLSAAERTALLDDFLDDVRGDIAVDDAWWAGLRAASLPELPEAPTDDQLDAWLELAELLADRGFRRWLRALTAEAWADGRPRAVDLMPLLTDARAAMDAGVAPDDPAADALVDRFVAAHAEVVDAATPQAALAHIDARDDPRARRYWELVGRVRGGTPDPAPGQAFDWLTAALRTRA